MTGYPGIRENTIPVSEYLIMNEFNICYFCQLRDLSSEFSRRFIPPLLLIRVFTQYTFVTRDTQYFNEEDST